VLAASAAVPTNHASNQKATRVVIYFTTEAAQSTTSDAESLVHCQDVSFDGDSAFFAMWLYREEGALIFSTRISKICITQ